MTANLNYQKLALLKNISIKSSLNESFRDHETDKIAGFLQNGKFSWMSVDATLRVISTDTGVEIAYYNFAKHHGIEGCVINHVEEINYSPKICILAVSIEFLNNAVQAGMVSIFCVQGCKILGSMDMCERITCCKYIDWETCRRSVLKQFHGTLAIGTDQGKLFLVDLMIPKDIKVYAGSYAKTPRSTFVYILLEHSYHSHTEKIVIMSNSDYIAFSHLKKTFLSLLQASR